MLRHGSVQIVILILLNRGYMAYLLDTNLVIDHLRSDDFSDKGFSEKYDGKELSISSISMAELVHGAHKSLRPRNNLNKLKSLIALPNLNVLDFGEIEAYEYGKLLAELEKKGMVIGSMDVMIAATARVNGLTVLSRDKKHFLRLKDFAIKVKIIGD